MAANCLMLNSESPGIGRPAASAPAVLVAMAMTAPDRDRLTGLLTLDGFAVRFVADRCEALQALHASPFDWLLLDEEFLGDSGVASLRQWIEARPERPLPVLFKLSDDADGVCELALLAGVLSCLPASASVEGLHLSLRNQARVLAMRAGAGGVCMRLGLSGCVLEALPGAVLITDARFRVVYVNTPFLALTGLGQSEVHGQALTALFSRIGILCDWRVIDHALSVQGTWQGEVQADAARGGRAYWLHGHAARGTSMDAVSHQVFSLTDISIHKHREQRLRSLAETDALTGLANRNLFLSRLDDAIEMAEAEGRSLALLFLDMDGFKAVNDQFGHGRGDQVLRDTADALRGSVRSDDLVARLGGDEFAILLLDLSRTAVIETARRILDNLGAAVSERSIRASCSIGVAFYPGDGDSASSLLKHADKAMYAVKKRGKNGYGLFSDIGTNDG